MPATGLLIQQTLGIKSHTFYRWMDEHAEFSDKVLEIRRNADQQVEHAFFRRATGYDYTETKKSTKTGERMDKDGAVVPVEEVTTSVAVKHIVPDAGAALNWLKNRDKDRWSDRREIEIVGDHVELLRRATEDMAKEVPDDE